MWKKALLVLFIAFLLVVGVFFAFVAVEPGPYQVERSITVDAPVALVYQNVADLKLWAAWSPWRAKDPSTKLTYSGTAKGVGAIMEWTSKKSGSGKMEVTRAEENTLVQYRLTFLDFNSTSNVEFTLRPEGADKTMVTWTMSGDRTFIQKSFWKFFGMRAGMANDFDYGLQLLKNVVERN